MFVFCNESVGALKTLLDFTIMANKSCTWGTCPQMSFFPMKKREVPLFFFAATITYGINNIFIFYLINFDITSVTIFFFFNNLFG